MARTDAGHEAVIKRVSRKHDHDEHGGAWKVAFADFCLALMCLFLVLWVMAAINLEQTAGKPSAPAGAMLGEGTGRQLETYGGPRGSMIERYVLPGKGGESRFNGVGDSPSKSRFESREDMQELAGLVQRLARQAGLGNNLLTDVTPQGLRVMLHDTDQQGMFARGSARLAEPFRDLLDRLGPLFAQIENQLLILGHTDALQYRDRGPSAYSNWTLSSQRAMAARISLLDGGMRQEGILQVIGMADRAPLDEREPTAAINRRIELVVLTPAQAQNLSMMFGMPSDRYSPLMDGVYSSQPKQDTLKLLSGPRGETPSAAPAKVERR